MKLTRYCIREARITWLLLALVVGGGVLAFLRLPTTEDPPFVFRFASVAVSFPGAEAATVDRLVSEPLETAALELPEVEYTEVTSRDGGMVMVVKLKDWIRDPVVVWDRLEAKLNERSASLPSEASPPRFNRDLGVIYGVLIGITPGADLSWDHFEQEAEQFRREVAALPEAGRVALFGIRPWSVAVELDMEAVTLSGVPLWELPEVLMKNLTRLPGGQLADRRQILGAGPDFESLQSIPVPLRGEDAQVELRDIASIASQPPRGVGEPMRVSGQPGLLLGVSLQEGMRVEALGRALRELIQGQERRPENRLRLEWIADEPTRVLQRRDRLMVNLTQSLVIVSAILVLVLGWREGILVSLLIPVALLLSQLVMYLSGLGINHVALGGFIVVLGMLVDNNIVVAERIIRHRSEGMAGAEAAILAASELHKPLLVSALTTIAAFLPVFLAQSAAGEYTRSLFLVVAIALLSAEVIVFTVTPLVSCRFFGSARWLKSKPGNRGRHPTYRRLLARMLRHRGLAMLLLAAACALAVWGFLQIPVRFFPPSEQPLLTVDLEVRGGGEEVNGETASRLDALLTEIRDEDPALRTWVVFSGRNAPRFVLNHRQREFAPELVSALVHVESAEHLDAVAGLLRERLKPEFPDHTCRISPLEVGPAIGAPVQIRIKGENAEALAATAIRVSAFLSESPRVAETGQDWGHEREGYRLSWDAGRAAEAGIGRMERAALLQMAMGGLPVGSIEAGGSLRPVFLKIPVSAVAGTEGVRDLLLPDPLGGEPYRLGDLATVEMELLFSRISRHAGAKAITVWADPVIESTPAEVEAMTRDWIERNALIKPGQWIEFWGEPLQAQIANRSLLREVPWAVLCILLLLLFQLKSWRSTGIILATIPLGLIGAIAGLLLTGQELNFMTLIGLVSLSGIVVNGSILLLDRIRINRESGMDSRAALLDAAEQRFRAILLTAATTVCGLLPLVFFGGPFWQPMAVAIVSGLVLATGLILLVVPVLHSYLFPLRRDKNQ